MAKSPAPPLDPEPTRFVDPVVRPIVRATDLGSVQVLKQGNLFLLTDPLGDTYPDDRGLGLYLGDTRRLSCSTLRVNGARPVALQASAEGTWRSTIQMTNPNLQGDAAEKMRPEETPGSQTLGISRTRSLDGAALEELVRVVNYATAAADIELELELAADAADIFEVRGWSRAARGRQLPVATRSDRATFRYDGLDGTRRATHVAFTEPAAGVEAVETDAVETGSVETGRAGPGARAGCAGDGGSPSIRERRATSGGSRGRPIVRSRRPTRSAGAGEPNDVLFPEPPHVDRDAVAASYHAWKRGLAEIRTDNELFNLVIERSTSDLRLLLNDGPGPGQRYLAAGVPWFATLFGRDAIIAALQTLAVRPQLAIETLEVLAALQASEVDPTRDAEPGKIPHELRTGEMARTGELPHRPYYGTADATPLWLVLLGATWDWTGDRALVDRLWPNVLRALEWIDRYGDRDGDGFVEYERRTALRAAWARAGRTHRTRSATGTASSPGPRSRSPRSRATSSTRSGGWPRWPASVASPTLAIAWTARRRSCGCGSRPPSGRASVATTRWRSTGTSGRWTRSPPTPGTACGAESWRPDRARRVADRLLAPDMFTGWGVRSYAAGQPGYNPIGYHTGIRLAARRLAHRRRPQALRPPRRRPTPSPAGCSRRAGTSPASACRSSSAASIGTRPRSRSRIPSPAHRRPGPRGRPSCSRRRCSASARTPTAGSWSS